MTPIAGHLINNNTLTCLDDVSNCSRLALIVCANSLAVYRVRSSKRLFGELSATCHRVGFFVPGSDATLIIFDRNCYTGESDFFLVRICVGLYARVRSSGKLECSLVDLRYEVFLCEWGEEWE